MSYLTDGLTQTATYWAPEALDAYGRPSFASPVALDCRWEDTTELFRDAQGREVVSKANVWLSQDVALGGFLLLGESAEADPRSAGAYEIRNFEKTPELGGTEYERVAWL